MSWLVANTVVAAAMALLALLAARCKAAPAVVHVLWIFVLLKLATPPLFEVPVDLSWWSAPPAAAPRFVVPLQLDDAVPDAVPDAAGGAAVALPLEFALGARDASAAASAENAGTRVAQLAVAVWAAGAIALLLWFAVGLWRGHRRLRALGPVLPSMRREIEALAARLGVRAPALRDDPDAGSPYVWSFGRACLVVPVRVLAAASPKGRAAVLAHELAHLRRGDHWLAHGELLLAVALWWHPLFWFARARMRLWAELACDAWAIACVPDATIDYATVLVQAVAAPDFAVQAPAVLAARPAARAAFERRLKMILNENVACRASRAWWLPFSSLALGLFTVPVAAQRAPQEPAKAEIRVNGKAVDELSAAERTALLEKLLAAEKKAEVRAEEQLDQSEAPKPAKKKARAKLEADPTIESHIDVLPPKVDARHVAPSAKDLQDALRSGLAQARVEMLDDKDLRELGITDQVVKLIDDLGAGKGLGDNLDAVVKGAMKGAGKMVKKELANDEDLRELGLTDSVTKLVQSLLENERTQAMVCDLARSAVERALEDAKHGQRGNHELKFDFDVDTSGLLDSLMHDKDLDARFKKAIQQAGNGAIMKCEVGNDDDDAPPPPKKKNAKGEKKAKLEVR